MVLRPSALVLLVSMAAFAGGCGTDALTSPSDAASDVRAVFGRSVHVVRRSDDELVGTVHQGSAVTDFAVVKAADQPRSGTFRFASGESTLSGGCAGVVVYSRGRHGTTREVDLAADIEGAVFHRGAPDAYCEG